MLNIGLKTKEVNDSVSISLRKGKEQNITAGELKEKVTYLVRNDLGLHFLQRIRGSPAYFNKLFYDLLGMIRQLGPCGFGSTICPAIALDTSMTGEPTKK